MLDFYVFYNQISQDRIKWRSSLEGQSGLLPLLICVFIQWLPGEPNDIGIKQPSKQEKNCPTQVLFL